MLTRREFLKMCLAGAGALAFSEILHSEIGLASEQLVTPKPPVIYLEAVTCSGNIMSILNANYPDIVKVIRDVVDLRVQYTIMAAEGQLAWDTIVQTAKERAGEYILLVEGTINTKANGMFGVIAEDHGRPVTAIQAFKLLAPKAKHIAAIGTCASYGGPYAARPNPSGARPISAFTDRVVVNVPGCPVHPDWAVGTLTHLILYGMPKLDQFNRPEVFFGQRVHDLCERRSHFESGEFARHLGDEGCLYRVGCKGPVSFCDVPRRQWGEHLNWYIRSNSPCIGCTEPVFPDSMEPFLAHLPNIGTPAVNVNARTAAYLSTAATGLAIGGHFVASLVTGRQTKETATFVAEQQATQTSPPGVEPTGATPSPERDEPALPDPDDRRRRVEAALSRTLTSHGAGVTPDAPGGGAPAEPAGASEGRTKRGGKRRRAVRALHGRRPPMLRLKGDEPE